MGCIRRRSLRRRFDHGSNDLIALRRLTPSTRRVLLNPGQAV
jgi:hypothetical protein